MTSLIYIFSKEIMQMNLFTKQKQTHRLRKWTYGCQGGEREAKRKLCLKWITTRNYCCYMQHRELCSLLFGSLDGRGVSRRMDTGTCMTKSLCCPPETVTALLIAYAAAAKSHQSCPTLCDPVDGSPPGSPVPGLLQARILEGVAISFSKACMHAS